MNLGRPIRPFPSARGRSRCETHGVQRFGEADAGDPRSSGGTTCQNTCDRGVCVGCVQRAQHGWPSPLPSSRIDSLGVALSPTMTTSDLTQRGTQACTEDFRVHPISRWLNGALNVAVQKLDRVLQRDDVLAHVRVHCSSRAQPSYWIFPIPSRRDPRARARLRDTPQQRAGARAARRTRHLEGITRITIMKSSAADRMLTRKRPTPAITTSNRSR